MASVSSSRYLPRRKLGTQGLEVSALGLGCMSLTGGYGSFTSEEAEKVALDVVKHSYDKGLTFFDTADFYGNHQNEIVLGKAIKDVPRDQLQIATKFGLSLANGKIVVRADPKYVRECCEASLQRLGVDYIDLYYQHRTDSTVPIEKTVGELKKLVEEGKVKYIGLSEACASDIRRAHAVHPITAVQLEWALWTRDVEEEIIPLCRELGIGIVAYGPLGRGFLAGKGLVEKLNEDDIRLKTHPRFQPENIEKNKLLYERIVALAEKHGCTPGQLSLAWLLQQGDDIVPIPGTSKVKNLEENLGSVHVKLESKDLQNLEAAVPVGEVSGESVPEYWRTKNYKAKQTPPLED
ncbi:hypothetical protein R1flu_005339 [Riccia fluitans]|uniref:NADP-dependent oxidoreductase domain-containing protein n=1 Tax=Riccia fluitans TaxID=41844 RepID=A0ABD1YSW6_9MARC